MFSTQQSLDKKTGSEGVARYEYLQMLTEEYQKTNSFECKQQVLANLANFAYDPINFEHLRQLNALDLFLAQLSQSNEELLHFGLAGLCNLSSDPENREYIIRFNGIPLLEEVLSHRNEEISLNALTTLMYLVTPESRSSIATPCVINKALHYRNSGNARLRNLGALFLEDHCTKEQISEAQTRLETTDIPLPALK